MEVQNVDFSKGLVPAIIQDIKTLKVLMLGYMDEQALTQTQETGKVTFYSRSKERLWVKGETSGNFLELKDIKVDCDSDTLLIKVSPKGPTCHKGDDTCWGEENVKRESKFPFLHKLEKVIESRLSSDVESDKSYIKSLARRGHNKIAQKVGEEAVELVIEALQDDDSLFLEEASDLFFHYLILLQDRGYKLKDILLILKDRHKK